MDWFLLFGDSITQTSTLGHGLSEAYIRRLDVINRGFSGYNTTQALAILPKFMPSPKQAKVRFMTIFFGANDARLPQTAGGPQQHVPIEQYKENLRAIATHPAVQAHHGIRIILITPPPVDERKLMQADAEKYQLGPMLRRTASTTARYAQAVRSLGSELSLPVLDVWFVMMALAGYNDQASESEPLPGSKDAPQNDALQSFLQDGLHLTRTGYEVLYKALMTLIERTHPAQMPERLPYVFPAWDDQDAWTHPHSSIPSTAGLHAASKV